MEFPMHWLIILVIVLVIFGGRKIPELMRGMGEGVRGFKEGMSGHAQSQQTAPPAQPAAPVAPPPVAPVDEKK
ncbi:MAG: twin-arginine translocase TatA/TatE family subunit [Candidatus Acidiferrum sp.]|jgi:sec-independent protein translocase protein TatA